MLLKNYQKEAVKQLLTATIKELSKNKESAIVFKAPTGSGKTIMMQQFLKDFSSTPLSYEYAFIWISVNDLSTQSKNSFEKNLEGSNLIFSELQDIKDKILQKNEILFINWEKIRTTSKETGDWKVLAMKDNEKDENLPTYLQNTHENGRKIILIIDESHRSLDTKKAQELIKNYIKPTLQIEVSATPDSKDYNQKIDVDIQDVILEGMIKKEILVNEKLAEFNPGDLETDKLIIDIAIKKQLELLELYKEEETHIKPLLLIQLPSESQKTSELDKSKLDKVIHILNITYNINFENQKLAIWLSDDKTNKDLIDIDNSPVEILIFKQAIATGWDCPRAQILVMFREIKKLTFEIQTVGRILRMPEQKHYDNEILNKAYVYTDLPKAEIGIGETAKNLIKNLIGIRDNDRYIDFKLPSIYKKRTDYQDLGRGFYQVLAQTLVNKVGGDLNEFKRIDNLIKLEKHIETKDIELSQNILSDGKILVDIDNHTGEKIIAENEITTYTQDELIKMTIDDFARNNVGPQFTNIARSYTTILEGLYYTLDYYFYGRNKRRNFYQKLILKNKDFFIDVLTQAKDIYKPIRQQEVGTRKKESKKDLIWSIPTSQGFSEKSILKDYKKNILSPSYIQVDSKNEILFIEEYLEKSEEVLFWYKNGSHSEEFFAIAYEDNQKQLQAFYPDFIVYYKSGVIGIFDPKSGFTLTEGVNKAIGLEKYIKEQNQKGKRLIGGLIEIRQVSGTTTTTMMINKVGSYKLDDRSDFVSFGDKYILNYDFSEFELYSKKYLKEIEKKIAELEKTLNIKEQELSEFIEEQKDSGDFDYGKKQELQNEIFKIKKNIKSLKIIN